MSAFVAPKYLNDENPPYRADSLNVLIVADIMSRGICSDQKKSSNDYYNNGLRQIISSNVVKGVIINELEANTNIETISWNLTYTDITPNRPTITHASDIINVVPLMPNEASLRNLTYSADLHVRIIGNITAHYTDGHEKNVPVNVRRHIGGIPIVVGSEYCNTHGKSVETLLRMGEDPSSYGGEVIVKGVSFNIDNTESSAYNLAKIYYNKGFKNEVIRFEIISKPGDGYENSAQTFIKFLTNGQIVITIDRDPLSNVQIPFYLIFRLFGWETDKQLFDNLMLDDDPNINQHILKSVNAAYRYKYKNYPGAVSIYDTIEIIKMLASGMKSFERKYNPKDKNSIKNVVNIFMNSMDKYLLPHIGIGPDFRDEKLRNLCHYMNDMFYVDIGILAETDRDSAANKRIHAIGPAMSKTTKTRWNLTINKPLSSAIESDLKKTPFDKINPNRIIATIPLKELEKGLTQPITQGNKAELIVGKSVITNRMSSSQLHRKSRIGIYSTKQQIYNPGDKTQKQSSRAHAMRAVHPSNDGYLCQSQTQEGESAGLNKQIAVGAHISMASSSTVLKAKISECKEIIPFSDATPSRIREGYRRVSVNGLIVGYTKKPQYVIDMYRNMRRTHKIDQRTTIYMDPIKHDVTFYCDLGRLMQILIIVHNNRGNTYDKPSESEMKQAFSQWINITPDHIASMRRSEPHIVENLLEQGIVEFISPGEQQTLYVAASFDELWRERHNRMKRFTHCRVPAAMFGLPTLLAAFPTCNQPVRIAYHTNHTRQAMGIPDMNWPFRYDTEYHYQPSNEYPLARTIAYDIVEPGGMNINVMIGTFTGKNQEDSVVMNKGSIERGRFPGIFFTNLIAEFEFSDKVGKPDPTTTDVSPHINYETIGDNGVPKIGTKLTKGCAAIGRYAEKTNVTGDDRKYADRSVVYTRNEEAYVVSVFPPNLKYPARNQDGKRIIRVKLAIIRTMAIGDKLCMKGTSEVLTDNGWKQLQNIDMEKDQVATLKKDGKTLDYVTPVDHFSMDYKGPMYRLETPNVNMCVTKNHKLYVKRRGQRKYELLPTRDVFGKRVRFKKNAINDLEDDEFYVAQNDNGGVELYPMNAWLKLLGMFIADGSTKGVNDKHVGTIILSAHKQRKIDFHIEFLTEMGVEYIVNRRGTEISGSKYPAMVHELHKLSVGAVNKSLPEYVWNLSQNHSRTLLDSLMEGDGSYHGKTARYYTSSPKLADDVTKLAFHCGWSGTISMHYEAGRQSDRKENGVVVQVITTTADELVVTINKCYNTPMINAGGTNGVNNIEQYEDYDGEVWCLTIPETHTAVYYSREDYLSPPSWTGNSTRSGQKGIACAIMRDSEMPYNSRGIKPDIIINPHSMPTRMTIAQMLESCVAKICAILGITIDCTAFKAVDPHDIGNALEKLGFHRDGTEEFFNPFNGRKNKTAMFVGPVFYQRLEKFWSDGFRVVSGGSIDLVSRHISDNGENRGLRLGEMEKDCIMAIGMSNLWGEKAYDHSHGFTIYYCRRCQDSAIVNHGNMHTDPFYRCSSCKDHTEIVELPSSWSSKLVRHSMNVCNTGMKIGINPFEFNRYIKPSQIFAEYKDEEGNIESDYEESDNSEIEEAVIDNDDDDDEFVVVAEEDFEDKKDSSDFEDDCDDV